MTRPICLTERRPVTRRLGRADAAALAADWRHVVDLVPTPIAGRYRLTARGWVGTFRTPGRVWEVVPKLGWGVAERLLDARHEVGTPGSAAGLRSALARRLAALMTERATAGLVRGYAEVHDHSPVVRGRIDFPAERRRPPLGSPGFAQTVDEFTADRPWNGWPVAVAGRLLDGSLDATARTALTAAVQRFQPVSPFLVTDPDRLLADPRLVAYRPLLGWCRVATDALAGGTVLFNLERLFEAHLATLFAGGRGGRGATPQCPIPVRAANGTVTVELRPDLTVIDARGDPVSVWDAKWKAPTAAGPHPDDLHQVLGYAAALGVRSAGLVYPGRRFSTSRYDTPAGVSVTVATCRLTGDDTRVRRAADRLRRLVFRA